MQQLLSVRTNMPTATDILLSDILALTPTHELVNVKKTLSVILTKREKLKSSLFRKLSAYPDQLKIIDNIKNIESGFHKIIKKEKIRYNF